MRTREMIRKATRDGREAGRNGASWVFDGNTTLETYRAFLKGLKDGDPMVLDAYNTPNLSGEYAGDPTPNSLAEDYGLDPEQDPDGWRLDAVCQAWEAAANTAFWDELERVARFHLA